VNPVASGFVQGDDPPEPPHEQLAVLGDLGTLGTIGQSEGFFSTRRVGRTGRRLVLRMH
jgi:hypothetical protein